MTENGVAATESWRHGLAAEAQSAGRFDVVFVCTGNRFRSPLAAALFEKATSGLPVDVHSMGTLDTGSRPPFDETLEQARRLALDLSAHRSQHLSRRAASAADLVVGFERTHLAVAVVEAGAARERVFTLPELVDLLEGDHESDQADPATRARRAVARADAARSRARRSPGHPEIPDPLGGPASLYSSTADEIARLVRRLQELLFR